MTAPARLPDAATLETVLAGLDPASADADLIPGLTAAFPGFAFGIAPIDDDYWRDTRSVLRADGTRLGELRPWMTAELAKADRQPGSPPIWRRGTARSKLASHRSALGSPRRSGLSPARPCRRRSGPLSAVFSIKAQRVRLPDPDAGVLLRWADRTYGF
jgi:hypothetical protein